MHGVRMASKADFEALKHGEERKRKTYACVVWASRRVTAEDARKLEGVVDLVVKQQTPRTWRAGACARGGAAG